MMLFPEAQRIAHEELDRVLGLGHLPDIGDKESLPYIAAVKLEVMR